MKKLAFILPILSLIVMTGVFAQDRPWDKARYERAMIEVKQKDEERRAYDKKLIEGLNMIKNPNDKEQIKKIEAIQAELSSISDTSNAQQKAAIDWQYADANGLPDAAKRKEDYDKYTADINQKNTKFSEDMRPFREPVDTLIAEGKLKDMVPYNPEFVEKIKHEREEQKKVQPQPEAAPAKPEEAEVGPEPKPERTEPESLHDNDEDEGDVLHDEDADGSGQDEDSDRGHDEDADGSGQDEESDE